MEETEQGEEDRRQAMMMDTKPIIEREREREFCVVELI